MSVDKYVLEIRAQYLQVVRFGVLRHPVIFALWLGWVSFLIRFFLLLFSSTSPSYVHVFTLFDGPCWEGVHLMKLPTKAKK